LGSPRRERDVIRRSHKKAPVISLSIAVPYYDDFEEALELLDQARWQLPHIEPVQSILVAFNPSGEGEDISRFVVPAHVTFLSSPSYRGLPHAKKLALRASTGDLVLFLFPGIVPRPERLSASGYR
jgi:hypothetical protein